MKGINVGIATVRINGLNAPPYYFEHKRFWAWDITFSDVSTICIKNLRSIYLSKDSMEEAEQERTQLKKNFSDVGIDEGDTVAVMFRPDGSIRAIRSLLRDIWLDVEDHFVPKTFMELVSSTCGLAQ